MARTAILERAAVVRHGRRLEYFTIAWNSLEGLVAVIAGAIAGSISLVGFGMDSFIEVTSGATLLWRMSVDADEESRERNERLSIRIVGVCFLLLAVYILNFLDRAIVNILAEPIKAELKLKDWHGRRVSVLL